MAVPRQPNLAGWRVVAFALAIGGLVIGVVMPMLLFHLGITVVEIAPGIDVVWVLFPAVAIVDWIMAYYFWRKAEPSTARGGPIVS